MSRSNKFDLVVGTTSEKRMSSDRQMNNIPLSPLNPLSPKESDVSNISQKNIYHHSEHLENPPGGSPIGTFVLLISSSACLTFINGVLPASLIEMEKEMSLSYQQQGIVGGLGSLGVSIASLFVTTAFQKYMAAHVLSLTLFLHSLSTVLVALTYNVGVLYIGRLFQGVAHSFIVIYAPVWINTFAPKPNTTLWMGLFQASVPLGIMFGYISASSIINFFPPPFTWRVAFLLQLTLQLSCSALFLLIDNRKVDVIRLHHVHGYYSTQGNRAGTGEAPTVDPFFLQVKELATNWIFIWMTLSLCALFFTVTGIQYWMTAYLLKALHQPKVQVMLAFSIISITGPLSGVFIGARIADSQGGYKGKYVLTAIKLCTAFGTLGFLFSIPVGLVGQLRYICPLLWSLLFFGGALIPTATGVVVNSVKKENQSTSSAISQLIYNIFGYFLAPILSAAVMDSFPDKLEGLIWGFRLILWTSGLGLIFIVFAWMACLQKVYSSGTDPEEDKDIVNELIEYRPPFLRSFAAHRPHSTTF